MPTPTGPHTRFRLAAALARARRRDPRLTQRELARRAGVSVTTVNRIARNLTTRVDLKTLDALARVLRVRPGALLEQVD